jgi:membrane protease YdiL (CAAX protease family)
MISSEQPNSTLKELALWEVASVVVSCLIAEWVVLSMLNDRRWFVAVPIALALVFMLFSHRVHGETLRDLGFRLDNFAAALKLLAIPTVVVVVVIIIFGRFTNVDPIASPLRARFLLVPLWALFQQYALQGYINRRLQLALGSGWKSVLITGLLFSVIHLPNPLLALLTLLGGVIWAAVYQRQPNLFALAVSHSITALTVTLFLPLNLITGLRVGFKYFG